MFFVHKGNKTSVRGEVVVNIVAIYLGLPCLPIHIPVLLYLAVMIKIRKKTISNAYNSGSGTFDTEQPTARLETFNGSGKGW